jgi:nitroimidazol reductase NimA-like FMN-containing flavoprotein (pyridoxamine 5'-phosphate oxidase superfamily)
MPTEALAADAADLLRHVPYGRLAATLRAMPFVVPARHALVGGTLLLRMHAGLGYHRAGSGSVVAYGVDNLHLLPVPPGGEPHGHLWSVQCIGRATRVEPTEEERTLLGTQPAHVDGDAFAPVYLRLTPELTTVHTLDYSGERPSQHVASTTI